MSAALAVVAVLTTVTPIGPRRVPDHGPALAPASASAGEGGDPSPARR
ncbi:hypothetical protein ACIP3B_27945 [Streptomyces anulatus]